MECYDIAEKLDPKNYDVYLRKSSIHAKSNKP